MRANFSPQSELRPALVGLFSPLRVRPIVPAIVPRVQPRTSRAMLTWRHPHLPPNYLGQSPVTYKTQGKGCVRYPN